MDTKKAEQAKQRVIRLVVPGAIIDHFNMLSPEGFGLCLLAKHEAYVAFEDAVFDLGYYPDLIRRTVGETQNVYDIFIHVSR